MQMLIYWHTCFLCGPELAYFFLAGTQETLSQIIQRTDSQNEQDRGTAAETGLSVTNYTLNVAPADWQLTRSSKKAFGGSA